MTRESILAAVKANQPEKVNLPDIDVFETKDKGSLEKFASVLQGVGGKVTYVSGYPEIARTILAQYGSDVRIVSPVKELKDLSSENLEDIVSIHDLRNVEVAVLDAHFGVAENGAVWITENEMQHRVLPFVTQHLAVVINEAAIVPTMHHAYDLIGNPVFSHFYRYRLFCYTKGTAKATAFIFTGKVNKVNIRYHFQQAARFGKFGGYQLRH